MSAIVENLQALNQHHLIEHIHASETILDQVQKIDIGSALKSFLSSTLSSETKADEPKKFDPINVISKFLNPVDIAKKTEIESIGWKEISKGNVCSVIMSGGQGTRLGFDGPKGMYHPGLLSEKSIFQIHIEKVMKIKDLCSVKFSSVPVPKIPIYIMTSDINHQKIMAYFKEVNYFGYPAEDIVFFEQGLEPTFTFDGKVIVESKDSLSLAPSGNGGIYKALKTSGAVDDMSRRGIKHLHVYGIDNVLTKVLDPLFIGACYDQNAEVGNKSVWRADKSEKVGVSAEANGRLHILEYTELPASVADTVDASGKLIYGAANICNHYFDISFLKEKVLVGDMSALSYHAASKKIPSLDPVSGLTVKPTANNGIKLETFIFDVFPLADRWVVMECDRCDEFAPVKNAPGSVQDSPDTARRMISDQAIRWLQAAGAILVYPPGQSGSGSDLVPMWCEVSPLRSYAGEGLQEFNGVTIQLPRNID